MMAPPTVIRFSSVAEFEEATRGVRPGHSVVLRFHAAGSCTYAEAAELYGLVAGWDVEPASAKSLRGAARHFDQLDGLQSSLELAEADLMGKVPMRKACFDAVRAAANAVVISADESSFRRLLDEVVIDAQNLGRVCRGLMFGGEDVEVANLTAGELDWLLEGGKGAKILADVDGDEALVLGGDAGAVPAGGDGGQDLDWGKVFAYDDAGKLLKDDNRFAVLAGLGDDIGEGVGGPLLLAGVDGGKLVANLDVGKALAYVDGGKMLPDGNRFAVLEGLGEGDGEDVGGKEDPPLIDLVELKEEMVVARLRVKVRKLVEAIAAAKRRVVVP